MSNPRRKARWQRRRAASIPVAKQEVPASNLPGGWSRWESPATPATPAPAALWVPEDCNRHLKDAARGLESIGYPLQPPAPIRFPSPRRHGRSALRC